jgi:tetratricopeptide (TPR) repeat protein
VDPYEALAGIAMTRGQVREAERLWRRQLALSRSAGMMGRHFFGVVQLGALELRYRGDTARALALVDSALRVTPMDSLLPGDRNYYDLARFYLAAGRVERARPLLAAAARNDSVLGQSARVDRGWVLSLLALTEGRGAGVLEELRQAAEAHSCSICVYPDLGRAYEMAGREQEAARTYEYYLTMPWLWRYEPDAVELGWTTLRLGELQERLGRREDAVRTYTRLLRLWEESDPPLRGVLDDVRARLAALTGDAGVLSP